MKVRMIFRLLYSFPAILILSLLAGSGAIFAQSKIERVAAELAKTPCCDFSEVPGVVWYGNDPKMTIRELASYVAPVYWFSPDEPVLDDKEGKDIRLPNVLPFEEDPDKPVVYYQYNEILARTDARGPAYIPDENDKNNSIIDLENVAAINLKIIAYFREEEGLGGHPHDVEPTEFKLAVWHREGCDDCQFALLVSKVTGEAHGLQWYYNTLEVDKYTKFPMYMLVEEGKHGMCTDKNSDGYYTPSYDVNKRVNDAWGLRDIMRSGALFTGAYQAWMAKVRHPQHRVFPPLPEDSPLWQNVLEKGEYAPNNAIYELRAFPAVSDIVDSLWQDKITAFPVLKHKIEEKEKVGWPEVISDTDFKKFADFVDAESFVKSLSISLYADGDLGFSFVFPLFIVKNFEDPMAGGYLTNRMILKDYNLRDFSWMLLYTNSASRWIDGYFSAGAEWDVIDLPEGSEKKTKTETNFVLETGIKFRVNITKSPAPLKYLGKLTEFWGFRAGVKNTGFFEINRLRYVLEFGAGTF